MTESYHPDRPVAVNSQCSGNCSGNCSYVAVWRYAKVLTYCKRYIGAGLAFSAIGAVGTGIGILFNGLLSAMAMNPLVSGRVFSYGLLGFALVESAILFALLGGLFILFV